ncbi:MAG: hypothetical protein PHR81_00970 [Bacteroidales bacterium]|jgi:hypothetical protein|nr:hypothetical protein [Bacteroidales bacterium]MDD4213361.1 hypothetical protein [Bacteroidales bacterium]
MSKNIFILILITFFISSCEGPKYFSVTVIDNQTKKPIDSVYVQVKPKAGREEKSAYNLSGYTDSLGRFVREEMVGYGLSIKRWDWYMEYEKAGYKHKVEINKTTGTVELEK